MLLAMPSAELRAASAGLVVQLLEDQGREVLTAAAERLKVSQQTGCMQVLASYLASYPEASAHGSDMHKANLVHSLCGCCMWVQAPPFTGGARYRFLPHQ